MTAYHPEFGEFKGYLIDVWNGTARFRRAKRSGVPHLKAYRNIEVNTLRIKRIISSISRG
jgi:hypothetical protein